MSCKLYKELRKGVINKEIKEKVIEVIRKELKFLIRNNILITPANYEKWFRVFCHIVENNQNLSDTEIFSLYEELINDKIDLVDGQALEIKSRKEIADFLEKIAESIDQKLAEAIRTIDYHQEKIDGHTETIKQEMENFKHENSLLKILKELEILKSQNENLIKKLEEYHKDVVRLNTELKIAKKEANIDFLTGLVNRRSFDRALNEMIKDFIQREYPFSLILMDLDDFKNVNDTYGHPAGDEVLREVSQLLRLFLRANTLIARIGGEEFAIILPGVELENAVKVAERIRKILENREIKSKNHIIKITASFGVTQVSKGDNLNTLYERVDKALYKSKNNGKNRVEFL